MCNILVFILRLIRSHIHPNMHALLTQNVLQFGKQTFGGGGYQHMATAMSGGIDFCNLVLA